MQIRTKLTLQFVIIVSTLLLIALCTIYYFSWQHRESEFHHQLIKKANTTAELLIKVREVDSSLLKLIDKNRKDIFVQENISVYNDKFEEIYTNNDSIHFFQLIPGLGQTLNTIRSGTEFSTQVGEMEIVGISYTNHTMKFVVLAGAIDRQGLNNLKSLKNILKWIFFMLLLVVGLLGWVFAGRALKPISKVVNEVDKISENNLNVRLDNENANDEIGRLITTFNKLLERIDEAFQVQNTFIANASHELRNPLAKITSQLEVTLLNERDKDSYKQTLSSVLEDIRNLNEVSHRLLELTKLRNDTLKLNFEPIRIDDLLWETKAEFTRQHPEQRVNFTILDLPEDENRLIVYGHPTFLKTGITNLMQNGCKFSDDQTVSVTLNNQPDEIQIEFRNKGTHIDQVDLPFVFEPFYRSKNSEGTHGYGIGLSLVKTIIELHKGRIHVDSDPLSGTLFTLILPISETHK